MADQSPPSRKDFWTETVLGKLDQVRRVAKKLGVKAVIDGGDFFHVKSPVRTSHSTIQQIAELHKRYPCPVYANVGNHDVIRGEISNLPKAPLEVLFATGVFERCYDAHEAVFEEDGLKVRVVGIPYHGATYDRSRLDIKKGDEDWLVVIAHLLASPKGGTMFGNEDIISYKELLGLDADVWAFGHSHTDQGITELGPNKYVINIGSLTRGSIHEEEVVRQPQIAVLTFKKDEVKILPIKLAVGAPEDVFDFETRVREEARALVIDSYVDSIRTTLAETKAAPLTDIIKAVDVPAQVIERALSLFEECQ